MGREFRFRYPAGTICVRVPIVLHEELKRRQRHKSKVFGLPFYEDTWNTSPYTPGTHQQNKIYEYDNGSVVVQWVRMNILEVRKAPDHSITHARTDLYIGMFGETFVRSRKARNIMKCIEELAEEHSLVPLTLSESHKEINQFYIYTKEYNAR